MRLTQRDLQILAALDWTPLTASQLRAWSATFAAPFAHERVLRRRLQALAAAGFVRGYWYASIGPAAPPKYYRLTPAGFRVLAELGLATRMPKAALFQETSLSLHEHTRRLAEVLTRIVVDVRRTAGVRIVDFHRENEFQVLGKTGRTQPDCRFTIETPGERITYCIEIDNGTEPVRRYSSDAESCERKIRIYDEDRALTGDRYFVLFLTPSRQRRDHVLQTAAAVTCEGRRTLVCAATLSDFLAASRPLSTSCFRTHRGEPFAMLSRRVADGDTHPRLDLAIAAVA